MKELRMTSPDLTVANIEKIAELFPQVVTATFEGEGDKVVVSRAIDFDLLRQELTDHIVEDPQERYQLDWPGKRAAAFAANTPIAKTLRPAREESVNFDTTRNLFIEGDNLDALKLLQESYLDKIKLIYIDPPYNTGSDFVFADNFEESAGAYFQRTGQVSEEGGRLVANTEANGRFHSDWLSMMYPRLKLARNLLSADGAIVVSIDDHEVHNLRSLMDEVMGQSSFVASVVWQKRYSRENRGAIGDAHEYLLVYARDSARFQETRGLIRPTEKQTEVYKNPNNDPRGRWRPVPMTAQGFRANQMYEIVTSSGARYLPPDGRCWSMTEPEYLKLRDQGRIYFGKNDDSQPNVIRYLDEVAGFVPWTWWPAEEVGHTDEARKEIRNLFGTQTVFDTPKPLRLMLRLLEIVVPGEGVVLDFFAGSGTLAHAVLVANARDGHERRFVMVQLPEQIRGDHQFATVADVAKERIRRAAQKLNEEFGHLADPVDVGFRTLKVDTTNMTDVLRTPDETDQAQLSALEDSVKKGRSDEDLLFQVLLDWGLNLTVPISVEEIEGQAVFVVDDGALIACFDTEVSPELVRAIAKREPLRAVFRDSAFASDDARINAEQVFREISPPTDVKAL
jgi:adenine-specific DNA-methyltransferase